MMRFLLLMGAAAGLMVGCGKSGSDAQGTSKPKPGPTAAESGASSGNPLTAPVDYLGAVGAAQKRAANVVDLTNLQRAVQAFQAGEDRLPGTLQELVSEGYLPRLPEAPKGAQYAYNPRTGEVRLAPAAAPAP